MTADFRRVAITGLGVKTPAGLTPTSTFDNLLAGKSFAQTIHFERECDTTFIGCRVPEFDTAEYFTAREGRRLSRATRLGLAAAIDAIADAGLDFPSEDDRYGVIVGTGGSSIVTGYEEQPTINGLLAPPPHGIPTLMPNATAAALSIRLRATGPAMTVSTSCASGSDAIGQALIAIRSGALEAAVAGGVEAPLSLGMFRGFHAARALSTRTDEPEAASRPFDIDRDGFVLAEGAAFVVLERWDKAQARGARIYAELAGYAANSDAYHVVAPRENGLVATRCMRAALADAGLTPAEVGHVNAHGTSTVYNDHAEAEAISRCFGATRPPVTASKSVVGHMIGAAGALEFVVTILSVASGCVPPVANHYQTDENCAINVVAGRHLTIPQAPAISNSFGFGGHNACLVVRPA